VFEASPLNQVERWFADLTGKAIRRESHRSVRELKAAILKNDGSMILSRREAAGELPAVVPVTVSPWRPRCP